MQPIQTNVSNTDSPAAQVSARRCRLRWIRDHVVIQRNPRSGFGSPRKRLLDLIRTLRRAGLRVRMFRDRDRISRWLAVPGHRERLRCLVAAGGDGTVGDALSRFPGVPLAILPSGTENLAARFLGIPKCGKTVGQMILAGRTHPFDLGQIGDRRFLLLASAGVDASVIQLVHAARKGASPGQVISNPSGKPCVRMPILSSGSGSTISRSRIRPGKL